MYLVAFLHTRHRVTFRATGVILICVGLIFPFLFGGLVGALAMPRTLKTVFARSEMKDRFTVNPVCFQCHVIFEPHIQPPTLCPECDEDVFGAPEWDDENRLEMTSHKALGGGLRISKALVKGKALAKGASKALADFLQVYEKQYMLGQGRNLRPKIAKALEFQGLGPSAITAFSVDMAWWMRLKRRGNDPRLMENSTFRCCASKIQDSAPQSLLRRLIQAPSSPWTPACQS
ncbi:hypothetical protein B0H19DRAFT_1077821 [Mycena capillaripes]|nr:hypothetical protein B0H19DRAFT_1077821 [Mycena capillaripes]